MICVHKLKGEPLWINPDQVVFVEGGHESVVTLTDGKHIIASDTPEEIAAAVRMHRAMVLALAFQLDAEGGGDPVARPVEPVDLTRHLRSVPASED